MYSQLGERMADFFGLGDLVDKIGEDWGPTARRAVTGSVGMAAFFGGLRAAYDWVIHPAWASLVAAAKSVGPIAAGGLGAAYVGIVVLAVFVVALVMRRLEARVLRVRAAALAAQEERNEAQEALLVRLEALSKKLEGSDI